MPPERCPHCGRFLSRRFVSTLEQRPAPCPRCDEPLTLADLPGMGAEREGAPAPSAPATTTATAPPEAADGAASDVVEAPGSDVVEAPDGSDPAPSVRPPDLEPETVRDDVLAGWDVGVGPNGRAAWSDDRRPFPLDTVVVAGTAAAGLLVGAAVDRRRGRGALVGAVGGGLTAALARRIWRLPT